MARGGGGGGEAVDDSQSSDDDGDDDASAGSGGASDDDDDSGDGGGGSSGRSREPQLDDEVEVADTPPGGKQVKRDEVAEGGGDARLPRRRLRGDGARGE